ncbi:MAG: S41 family peptidase [Capnocytophaga sp.]|uniref:S41 family peptidase n=1 Tax=Capnocytophaga sp. TaxID=44737 RepID=UPI003F9FFB64
MKKLTFYMLLAFSLFSCVKTLEDDNQKLAGTSNYTGSDTDLRIRDFIWKGLNQYYLWQSESRNLQDSYFGSLSNTLAGRNRAYTTFLKSYDSPETLFVQGLLYQYGKTDRFSYITDDYVKLENQFKGITASTGMHNLFVLKGNLCYGIVQYVVPGSDADRQGLQRGDLFEAINGKRITQDNINELLNSNTYTFEVLRLNEQKQLYSTGRIVNLQNTETPENPVLIKKTFQQGTHKVAYLMYTAFIANYNYALNEAFAEFKAAGVTDLVLDLRYNGGGSVDTAVYLASMITGQFEGNIFAKEKWNAKMQPIQEARNGITNYFLSRMKDGTNINSLNLNKVYVLTTKQTASASELVINGLKPYIQVVQIGTTTIGKNQGSITIYDFVDAEGKVRNPNHKWAMQPLVLKIENAKGEGDYVNGIAPDIEVEESIYSLGTLGDPKERLLSEALAQITGRRATARPAIPEPMPKVEVIATSKDRFLGYNEMYK